MVRTAIAAAAGGTAAEIGGGSFENGAISAAYTYMFNHAAVDVLDLDRDPTASELWRETRMFPDAADEVGPAFAGAASQTAGMALDFFPQERLLAAVGRFFRGFGRFFGLGGKGAATFFEGAKYSPKVLQQMKKADDVLHAFPRSVDRLASKFGQWTTKTGADGKAYQWLEMRGSYGGKTGTFEFIKDSNGVINHRYLKPD